MGIRHLERDQIEELLELSADFKLRVIEGRSVPKLDKEVVGMLFFENSTRTRVSFEQAAHYLGLKTANFSSSGSSMSKGETLKDTILTLRYERLNGLVMRHRMSGSANLAARHFGGPVLNAGDGQHEHPTQALGDALTIIERKGDLDGLVVSIVGDVEHSRVARSNAWLLSKMGAEVRFVGPRTLMPQNTGLLPGKEFHDLATGIDGADVIICLRLQKERMAEGVLSSIGEYASMYQVNRESLKYAAEDCLVMHPGPLNRGIEVDDVAADGEQSAITAQIENGIFVRMASLYWCFTGSDDKVEKKKGKKK
ncbi:aspartate carbamoyltransferase catalytic subunit [Fimbriimonas ginsengisoli Gsoil 348]|uniref:Aspartate carbamoyltransferase n=1 Tax=Fimbriimonas ginsengisoli Gsoil 348 TaxID=661478 RepID=A0A068NUC1_FIMGI|nr:aspartate carbamoyltransferase catalytic subunit [Fimbriimonas ginsengisoli Gsoil 348]